MVQDHEFIYPFYRLKEEGIETAVFNGSKNQVLGFFGTKVPPQKDDHIIDLKDVAVDDFDLLRCVPNKHGVNSEGCFGCIEDNNWEK